MSFSTPFFYLIFLPVALLGFQVVGHFGRRWAIGFLVFMSLFFYYCWNHHYVLFLLASILTNFIFSNLIALAAKHPRVQSFWLATGIAVNLAALCYFKYLFPLLNFFTKEGLTHRNWGAVILPLGISFFTFTQIAYLVDLRQGMRRTQGLISYCAVCHVLSRT